MTAATIAGSTFHFFKCMFASNFRAAQGWRGPGELQDEKASPKFPGGLKRFNDLR